MTDEEILERVLKMGFLMEAAGKLFHDFQLKAKIEGGYEDEVTRTMGLMAQMCPGFFSAPDDEELGERAQAVVKLYKEVFEGEYVDQ